MGTILSQETTTTVGAIDEATGESGILTTTTYTYLSNDNVRYEITSYDAYCFQTPQSNSFSTSRGHRPATTITPVGEGIDQPFFIAHYANYISGTVLWPSLNNAALEIRANNTNGYQIGVTPYLNQGGFATTDVIPDTILTDVTVFNNLFTRFGSPKPLLDGNGNLIPAVPWSALPNYEPISVSGAVLGQNMTTAEFAGEITLNNLFGNGQDFGSILPITIAGERQMFWMGDLRMGQTTAPTLDDALPIEEDSSCYDDFVGLLETEDAGICTRPCEISLDETMPCTMIITLSRSHSFSQYTNGAIPGIYFVEMNGLPTIEPGCKGRLALNPSIFVGSGLAGGFLDVLLQEDINNTQKLEVRLCDQSSRVHARWTRYYPFKLDISERLQRWSTNHSFTSTMGHLRFVSGSPEFVYQHFSPIVHSYILRQIQSSYPYIDPSIPCSIHPLSGTYYTSTPFP